MSRRRLVSLTSGTLLCALSLLQAQSFTIARTGTFVPQQKTVLLLQNAQGQKPVILFQTNLRVNTDGSPLSYHPQDLRGKDKALNNICNAIAVRRVGSKTNLCFTEFATAIRVVEQFRDTNYRKVPDGFEITWANVLATAKDQGRDIPCVFTTGPFKGYFGSLTALTNGLTGDTGECGINDQVNPLTVPALVLVGGQTNVVRSLAPGWRSAGGFSPEDRAFHVGDHRGYRAGDIECSTSSDEPTTWTPEASSVSSICAPKRLSADRQLESRTARATRSVASRT